MFFIYTCIWCTRYKFVLQKIELLFAFAQETEVKANMEYYALVELNSTSSSVSLLASLSDEVSSSDLSSVNNKFFGCFSRSAWRFLRSARFLRFSSVSAPLFVPSLAFSRSAEACFDGYNSSRVCWYFFDSAITSSSAKKK